MIVFRLKAVTGVLSVLFAVYAGWQAISIAQAGVLNQIPQLEGDGGGALIFAVLCGLAGIAVTIRPTIAIAFYVLSVFVGVGVAILYQDLMLWFWSAGACALGVLSFESARRAKHVAVALKQPSLRSRA